MRVGQGFDLHRLEPGRPFWLGGVLLDAPKGPVGHSDGDVLLHALADALLGAAGLGDIGDYFPPSDPQWAGADSATFLSTVLEKVHAAGFTLINADMTILLEAPKLFPYKAIIRSRLSALLALPESAIGVKAKTMEGLGPIGLGEAVAAQVVVLLN